MNDFAELVLKRLSKRYGSSLRTQLSHESRTDLFVSALLSPQCTDKQVNRATQVLFKHFRTFDDYANADLRTLRRYLKGINYYKTKAKHLKDSARLILDRFNGWVPKTMKELMELEGVGRKVANVILSEGYGINEGIAVDTHVAVVTKRLGLTRSKDPYVIEKDLMEKIDKKDWRKASNLFIELGRDVCTARVKHCALCVLNDMCPSSDVKLTKIS